MIITAHSARAPRAPENDDRWLADVELGLFYVADGSGPTYGGYHAPFGLDPGLEALREAFARPGASGSGRLIAALGAADRVMRGLAGGYQTRFEQEAAASPDDRLAASLRAADACRPERWRGQRTHCHFGGSVTACCCDGDGALGVVQLGGGRAYLARAGAEPVLLVRDHTLPTALEGTDKAGEIDASLHRRVLVRMLGLGEAFEPDQGQARLAGGEVVLLCSDGVWNHEGGGELVRRLVTASEGAFRRLLDDAARAVDDDATCVRLRAGC
jgi:serine/threonine protein phosphatase PrpC